jgi:hypothetical protein
MTVDFSSETMDVGWKRHIFQVLKEKNCQTKILSLVKLFFRNEDGKDIFTGRPTLK